MIISYKQIPLEILDVYEDGIGVKWLYVRALKGKPFVGGNKWPIWTEYSTIKADDLTVECNCVLPEQSCRVCREAARKVYGENEIPFR